MFFFQETCPEIQSLAFKENSKIMMERQLSQRNLGILKLLPLKTYILRLAFCTSQRGAKITEHLENTQISSLTQKIIRLNNFIAPNKFF